MYRLAVAHLGLNEAMLLKLALALPIGLLLERFPRILKVCTVALVVIAAWNTSQVWW